MSVPIRTLLPVSDAVVIETVDLHVAGEPARVVLDGAAHLPGRTLADRRARLVDPAEPLRTVLMHEPRGHEDMFGVIAVPATDPAADVGALYIEHTGCPETCVHGTIGLLTLLARLGRLPVRSDGAVTVETAAGLVGVTVHRVGDEVESVSVHTLPMSVAGVVRIDGPVGPADVAIVGGPTWVALVDEATLGLRIAEAATDDLVAALRPLRAAVRDAILRTDGIAAEQRTDAAATLAGSPFAIVGAPTRPDCRWRTFVGFGDASVDRSPCGTASAALAAAVVHRGDVAPGEPFGVEAISGERFEASASVIPGGYAPTIRGRAHITGVHSFVVEPGDPLSRGFRI